MTSLESMLAALHSADVKHVFQMPEMPWPEAGPQRDFLDYQHFLPYTLDKPDSVIQWSYGLNPADPVLQDLIHLGAAAENGEPTAPCDLASKGFEAVLVEKRAYDAPGLAEIERAFTSSAKVAFDDTLRRVYLLPLPGPGCQ